MANTNSKFYTNKDMARICNVSEASMTNLVKSLELVPIKTGKYGRKYYNGRALEKIKEHYKNKAKSSTNSTKSSTKDDIINQLTARVNEQAEIIKLLKKQLTIKDEQIATTTKIADQAQKLDLTTHNQKGLISAEDSNHKSYIANKESQHGALWKLFH